jgi:hypothetical protein
MRTLFVMLFGVFLAVSISAVGQTTAGAKAPFFNATGAAPFQEKGSTVLNICCGTLHFPPAPDCNGNCDTLIGYWAGRFLPSNDYLSTCIGFNACGTTAQTRPELTCTGWNACGLGSTANFQFNAVYGINALGSCTDLCSDNVVVGTDAARDTTKLQQSVAIGSGAAGTASLTQSVFVGYQAGNLWPTTSTGTDIIAIGYHAGFDASATSASTDILIGNAVGVSLTTGFNLLCIATQSCGAISTGHDSIFEGWKSGASATNPQFDNCIGVISCSNGAYSGIDDVVLGYQSFQAKTTGFDNTCLGFKCAFAATTGNNNTIVGAKDAATLNGGSNNTIIGNNIDVLATGTANYVNINGAIIGYAALPTIASGFGSSPTRVGAGSFFFSITVGTGGTDSTGVITLSAAPNAWDCLAQDVTTQSSTVFVTRQIGGGSATSVTLGNYNTSGAAAAWVAGDVLNVRCMAR